MSNNKNTSSNNNDCNCSTNQQEKQRCIGQYLLGETLGKGMSGKVKKATHSVTGEKVALKIIDKAKATKRTLSQLHTEIMALKTLNHPNILQLFHVEVEAMYPKKNGDQIPSIVLALQLAEGGELFDFMMFTGFFSEVVSRTLFRQLLSALQYCHERGIYHRDIKPENLLLDDKYQLKIADFGLAAIRQDPEELLHTECGTRSYMAPEILGHKEYDGAKADVWSAGVVLFIMLAGNPPFQLAKKGDWWFNAVSEGDYERFWRAHKRYAPHFPAGAQGFISYIFQSNPQKRPTVEEVSQHEWIQGMCLNNQALYREMSTRRSEVEREKEKEREKAREEKMRQSVSPTAASGKLYDPFAARAAYRYAGGSGDLVNEPVNAPLYVKAPSVDGHYSKGYTFFYSPASADTIIERLHTACNQLCGQIKTKGTYHLRAVLPLESNKVELDMTVRSLPESEGGIHVVSFTRRRGDPFAFHRAFKRVLSKVPDLQGCGGNGGYEEELEQPQDGSNPWELEDIITNRVEMI